MSEGSAPGDDQVIATAFKRSLLVILGLLVLAGGWWAVRVLLQTPASEPGEAERIDPQSQLAQDTPPVVHFRDITAASGVNHRHRNGAYGDRLLPETMGGGVAFLDYDDDQQIDLLFVSGSRWPWREAEDPASSLVLYRGAGDGTFADVTHAAGLKQELYGMGVAVGDYDGDGLVDFFVTSLGPNRLFRNVDGEHFEDRSTEAGVTGASDAWSTGATFIDYDRDGDLDLFAANYVEWSRDLDFEVDYRLTGIGRAYGPPTQYAGTYSYLYRNDGNGHFSDVSASAGIRIDNPATGQPLGKALAVLPVDVDDDGWPDLLIANDTVRNFLFRNRAGQGFDEIGIESGLAFDNSGVATGAMGVDYATLDASAAITIAIGNFANEMSSFYVRPDGSRVFTDEAVVAGIGPVSRQALTFGLFFFDYDLDGRLDLLQANGHVENDINVVQPSQQYAQQPQLFWNCGVGCNRQYVPVVAGAGSGLSRALVGRGAAYADIDRDGDQDVILTQIGAEPVLLRNEQTTGHNWVQFDVLTAAGSPAYGATVEIVAGEHRQRREIVATRSYLSQVESTLSFGLSDFQRIDYADIRWPDGRQRRIPAPAVRRRHRVEPAAEAMSIAD